MASRRKFHPRVYADIIANQGGKCNDCGESLGIDPRGIEFDHCQPLWINGTDTPDNLQALCRLCHKAKTMREATERARTKRLAAGPKLNAHDRMLAKYLHE